MSFMTVRSLLLDALTSRARPTCLEGPSRNRFIRWVMTIPNWAWNTHETGWQAGGIGTHRLPSLTHNPFWLSRLISQAVLLSCSSILSLFSWTEIRISSYARSFYSNDLCLYPPRLWPGSTKLSVQGPMSSPLLLCACSWNPPILGYAGESRVTCNITSPKLIISIVPHRCCVLSCTS
jgi:hypothetical protein